MQWESLTIDALLGVKEKPIALVEVWAKLCPYGVPNSFNEEFAPGVFDAWVNAARSIPMLFGHQGTPVGVWRDFESRADGLYASGAVFNSELSEDLQKGSWEVSVSWGGNYPGRPVRPELFTLVRRLLLARNCKLSDGERALVQSAFGPREEKLTLSKNLRMIEASVLSEGNAAFPGTFVRPCRTVTIGG